MNNNFSKNLRTKRELKEDYNNIAPNYDRWRFGSPGGNHVDILEQQAVIKLLKGISVLEIGTGTGRYGMCLGRERYKFIGIDIAENMIKVVKEKIRGSNGTESIEPILMDAENLAFRNDIFDNIICIHTLQYFLRPLNTLKEFHRVLKIGAICIVSFDTNNRLLDLLDDLRIINKSNYKQVYYSYNDIHRLLKEAGFTVFYNRYLFNLPTGLYRRLPNVVVAFMEKIDEIIEGSQIAVVAGVKEQRV